MSTDLGSLYKQLQQAFTSQPSDLQKSGQLLAQLKVTPVAWAYAIHLSSC